MKYSKKSLIVFFSIVIALSAIFEGIYVVTGNELGVLFMMWTPALAALVSAIIIKKENKDSEEKVKLSSLLGFRLSKICLFLISSIGICILIISDIRVWPLAWFLKICFP